MIGNAKSAGADLLAGTTQLLADSLAQELINRGLAKLTTPNNQSIVAVQAVVNSAGVLTGLLPAGSTQSQTVGGGSWTAAAFSTTVSLAGTTVMPASSVVNTSGTAFTPAASPAAGATCYVKLCAGGASIPAPTFSGFKQWGGSQGWNNTVGIVNNVQFWYDGTTPYYSVAQDVGITAQSTYLSASKVAGTGNPLTVTMSAALNTGVVPALSSFSLTTTNGGTQVLDALLTGPTISGSSLSFTTFRAPTTGDVAQISYTPPASNALTDSGGNILFAWQNAPVTIATAPIDALSANAQAAFVVGYSLRKLRGAYTGAAISVVNSGYNGGVAFDVGFTSAGALDTSVLSTLTGTIQINKWYNQGTAGTNYDLISQFGNPGFSPTLAVDSTAGSPGKFVASFVNGTSRLISNAAPTTVPTDLFGGANNLDGIYIVTAKPTTTTANSGVTDSGFASVHTPQYVSISTNGVNANLGQSGGTPIVIADNAYQTLYVGTFGSTQTVSTKQSGVYNAPTTGTLTGLTTFAAGTALGFALDPAGFGTINMEEFVLFKGNANINTSMLPGGADGSAFLSGTRSFFGGI